MSVKHEDVEKYYNEHKSEFVREEQITLQEILISTEGKDAAGMAAAEKKAKDLVARARKGERFAEMARDNSDSVTAKGMGELPPFKKGVLEQEPGRLGLEPAQGLHHRSYSHRQRVSDSASGGPPESRPSRAVGSGERNHREAARAHAWMPPFANTSPSCARDAFLEIKADYIDTGAAPGKDTAWVDPAQLKPETVKKEEVVSTTGTRGCCGPSRFPGPRPRPPVRRSKAPVP